MDAIFGKNNFRNEIVWKRATAKKGSTKKFGAVHDAIFYYVKNDAASFSPVYLKHDPNYIEQAYSHQDTRGRFQIDNITAAGSTKGDSSKPWRGIKVRSDKHWAVPTNWPDDMKKPPTWETMNTQQKLDYMDSVGLIYWPERGTVPRFKRYLSTTKGAAIARSISS